MKPLRLEVESRLQNAAKWWKWLLFLRRSLLVAIAVTLAILFVGLAMSAGWFSSPGMVGLVLALSMAGGMLAWAGVAVMTADSMPERSEMASAVEQSYVPLLDRLNTLVFIHDNRVDDLAPYADAIEKQTVDVLQAAPDQCPFQQHRIRTLALILAGLLLLNVAFCAYYRPWNNLAQASQEATQVSNPDQGTIPEIPQLDSPAEKAVAPEDQEPWGEVRFSEPGRDLRVTVLDVVPLQIEAVTNRDIDVLQWYSSRNGEELKTHTTHPPQEPCYAVHQTEIAIDESGLQNWDVLWYFADVTTANGLRFQSDIYFLDVVPFAEQLEKLPGGAKGATYQALNDLTSMVERHEEIIRQTRRLPLLQKRSETDRAKRYAAFAQEQDELALAARYLKARLQQQLDRAPLDVVNQKLDEAEVSLEESKQLLNQQNSAAAEQAEHRALAQFATARKALYDAALENPDRFQAADDDPLAEAELPDPDEMLDLEQLKRLAEATRQQAEGSEQLRDEVARLIQQQRQIQEDAESPLKKGSPQLASRQHGVHQSLEQLASEHPESVEQLFNSWQWAQQSTSQAADSLSNRAEDVRERVGEARQDLEALHQALQQSVERARLIESLTIERRLQENMRDYGGMQDKPEEAAAQQRTAATAETNDIISQLEKLAGKDAAQDGPAERDPEAASAESALQQALNAERKEQIDADGRSLRDARLPEGIREAAGSMNQNLEPIAEALQQQNQSGLQQAGQDKLAQQMKAMQRRADELQAARQFVQDSLLKERDIERSVRSPQSQQIKQHAPRQEELNQSFQKYTQQHPEPFREATKECQEAGTNMSRASQAMRSGQPQSQQLANQSADSLQRVDDALEGMQQQDRLADALRLQQMLQDQAQRMRDVNQNPSKATPSACKSAAGQCNSLADQFQQMASQGGGSGMSPQLGQSMSEGQRQQIQRNSQALSEAQTPEAVGEAAGQLAQDMQRLAEALSRALGQGMLGQNGGSPLRPGGQEAVNRGLRRLESEARRVSRGQTMPDPGANPLRQGAMTDLALGIHDLYGYNERTLLLVQNMKRDLMEPKYRVDQETVLELLSQIQGLRREVNVEQIKPDQENPLTDLDPSRFPPDYRKPIETYFEELSKQR